MSGRPSWAITERSAYSTSEWMMLSRWSTTSIFEAGMSNSHRASTTSRPLFIRVAESMVILSPIFQFGCWRACSTVTSRSCSLVRFHSGPPDVLHAVSFHGLEERAVLAVHGEDPDAALAGLLLHEAPRHHHRLLVRQGDELAGLDRPERGHEPGAADDGRDDKIGLRQRGGLREPIRPVQDRRLEAFAPRAQALRGGRIRHGDDGRGKRPDLFFELVHVIAGREADRLELLREFADDVQGVGPDGPGGTQDDDPLHACGASGSS